MDYAHHFERYFVAVCFYLEHHAETYLAASVTYLNPFSSFLPEWGSAVRLNGDIR